MDYQEKVYPIQDVRDAIDEGDIRELYNILRTSKINLNVNYGQGSGSTPLLQAINNLLMEENEKRRYIIIKILLKFGADPNLSNSVNFVSPIYRTEKHRCLTILLLEHGVQFRKDSPGGIIWLRDAFDARDYELAIALMNAGVKKESIYEDDPILDDQIDVGEADKFFNECAICSGIFDKPKK